MPIYEYRCDNCGNELEAFQKLSEAPLVDCPECGNASLRKKVSAAAFRLKGSGWYETDFKSGSKKNVSGGETNSDSSTSSSDGSDSKAKSSTSDTAKSSKNKGSSAGSGDS